MIKPIVPIAYYRLYRELSPATRKIWLGWIFEWQGRRKRMSLKLWYMANPTTIEERDARKEAELKAAEIIRKLNADFVNSRHGIIEHQDRSSHDFIEFAQAWIANHSQIVKDIKKHLGVIRKLKLYAGKPRIFCFEITRDFLERFVKYLQTSLNGESVHSYFVRLRQIVNAAFDAGYFASNPALRIKVSIKPFIVKQVLSIQELQVLFQTPLRHTEIKRAFLFSAIIGLRWCDCKSLRWSNIRNGILYIIQRKTLVALEIPLNADAIALLGKPQDADSLIFNLPSHTAALKWLTRWMKSAGIEKHITFHCGRHSAGTNLLANGASLITTSRILGHVSVVNTQRYVRTSEDLKRQALNQMPSIFKNA